MATVQALFNLPGGQTEGFLESLLALMGIDLPVPDHSTLSRRMGKVEVELPVTPSQGAIHVVVDSTGVKGYGEGEWKVRQHGVDKRRTWRKLHVGVNEATGEILAAVASTNNLSDDEALGELLDGIDREIEQVSGDGAYDKRKCYDAIAARGAKATIPPRFRCGELGKRPPNWGGASTQSSPGTDSGSGTATMEATQWLPPTVFGGNNYVSIQDHLWRNIASSSV